MTEKHLLFAVLAYESDLIVFVNVCEALAYTHSRGIIHRDTKPENIVLGDYGEAIVLDHRTDIYGLGTILFEILTSHPASPKHGSCNGRMLA